MGKSKDAKPAKGDNSKGKADKSDKSKKGGKGGKGDADSSDTKSSSKIKGAQSINVRHILVCLCRTPPQLPTPTITQK